MLPMSSSSYASSFVFFLLLLLLLFYVRHYIVNITALSSAAPLSSKPKFEKEFEATRDIFTMQEMELSGKFIVAHWETDVYWWSSTFCCSTDDLK